MSSPPVSETKKQPLMNDMNSPVKESDGVPSPKNIDEDACGSTITTPAGSDDEAYDSSKSEANDENEKTLGTISKMPVIPYRDRANAIIETLTDSDKKILRLYDENAVIGGPFPVKLQIILKVTEILGQQHIISWLPHGRSFMIHRPREFEEKIMGEFFKQTKLSSFKRQLNLYDFQRVTRGTDCGSYYHEMFLRGKPLLAKRMIRRKIKGTKNLPSTVNAMTTSNTGDDQDNVPDFYTMPFVGTNRSGLDLQQASRVMNNRVNNVPSMGLSNQGVVPGGLGGLGSAGSQGDSYTNRLHGGNHTGLPGLSNPHLGANPHLSGGHGLVPPTSSPYDSLLNRSGVAMNSGALAGLSSQAANLHQNNTHDLPLSSLQHLQNQQLMKNDLMSSTQALSRQAYPAQIQSTYAVAMENLNKSYAIAASALRRDLDTASNMMTQDDLVAANQLRHAGGLPNSYNLNGQGW